MAALWRGLTTRQPGGFIMEKLHRAQAVIINLKNLCLCLYFYPTVEMSSCRYFYGKDLLYPTMFKDQDLEWRNPHAGQYHIAYQDPSPNPRWRMKQIVEFKDDRDIGRRFQISGCNMVWMFRNTQEGGRNFGIHNLPNGILTMVPEPLW